MSFVSYYIHVFMVLFNVILTGYLNIPFLVIYTGICCYARFSQAGLLQSLGGRLIMRLQSENLFLIKLSDGKCGFYELTPEKFF